MSEPQRPFNLREAILAMQSYADYYTTTDEGDETDVDFLWSIAEQLVLTLREAVECIAEMDPARREEIQKALTESDAWVVGRASTEPSALEHLLTVYMNAKRIADLPRPTIEALLQHEDQSVRLRTITAIGEGRNETQSGRTR